MAKIPLNEQSLILREQLLRAEEAFEVWWFYGGPKRESILASMNLISPSFFWLDEQAQLVLWVVSLANLLSDDKTVISIKNHAPLYLKPKVDLFLTKRSKTIDGLRTIRNKIFAHRCNKTLHAEAWKKANLTYTDVKDLFIECRLLVEQITGQKMPDLRVADELNELLLNIKSS